MTATTTNLVEPPSEIYDDEFLYGERRDATKWVAFIKECNNSECVMYPIGTFVDREQWNLKNLIGSDKRIRAMMEGMNFSHALPLQRHCWPQMNHSFFPFVCVSPKGSGKTFAHLLYIVSKTIAAIPISKTNEIIATANEPFSQTFTTNGWSGDDVNVDDFITHPKYIIICSSQLQVEAMDRDINQLKKAAYGEKATGACHKNLPPSVRTINVHQEEDRLALRCNESEILIATPGALIKCFRLEFLTFAKCKSVIFDELDLTLQLHNSNIREIIKHFLIETQDDNTELGTNGKSNSSACQMYMFSRKWTDLVKQFVSSVFVQKTLIFGSIAEASLYANIRYEINVATLDGTSKIGKLHNCLKVQASANDKTAIVCKSNEEAEKTSIALNSLGLNTKFLQDSTALISNRSKQRFMEMRPIYVLSDEALDFIVDCMNDINHLIHYSIPKNMLTFDQRFRLMYSNIKDLRKNLTTTLFISLSINDEQARDLYDIISRSSSTLHSTKLELRDFLSDRSSTFCWRWAATGLCRLEKLSREDRFGSYCSRRHSINPKQDDCIEKTSKWPISGQFKITITHLISPNEFFFWFEAHRDKDSLNRAWTKFETAGSNYMKKVQEELNKYRNTADRSVPLKNIKKGKVYGVYLHERVERIILLEEPKFNQKELIGAQKLDSKLFRIRYNLEYSKQCEVLKIDYGVQVNVYLRSIFELPEELSSIPPQCYRGFHLGVKPTDNEPNWLYKAKKYFYDRVCVNNLHEITVWLRFNNDNCFWFENMVVTRKLTNIDGNRLYNSEPHTELCQAKFADKVTTEPSCLLPSERIMTLSKWHVNKSADFAQYAFLRLDKDTLDLYILHNVCTNGDLYLIVRQVDYNKQLVELEKSLMEDHNRNKLQPLGYLDTAIYCLARVLELDHPTNPIYTINRCKIIEIISAGADDKVDDSIANENKFLVSCLDHGDNVTVTKSDLYLAPAEYLSCLPFQAIRCKLAEFNSDLIREDTSRLRVRELLYDYTRDQDNELLKVKCRFNSENELYLYVPVRDDEEGLHKPLIGLLENNEGLKICLNNDPQLRVDIRFEKEKPRDLLTTSIVDAFLSEILLDIVSDIMKVN